MTRAERRREAKKQANKTTYTLTIDQINEVKKKASDEAIETMFAIVFGLPILVLRDWDGDHWGSKRLERFMRKNIEAYNDFKAGRFDLIDIMKIIKDETGFDLMLDIKK